MAITRTMGGDGSMEEKILTTFKASAVMATVGIEVKLDTSNVGYVSICGDGEEGIGILETAAAAIGDQVAVCMLGRTICKANGAFTVGDKLNSAAATGKVDTAGAGEFAIGIALQTATAQDDEMEIFVNKHLVS